MTNFDSLKAEDFFVHDALSDTALRELRVALPKTSATDLAGKLAGGLARRFGAPGP